MKRQRTTVRGCGLRGPRRYLTQREKTSRAYIAYLDLIDTADHLREEMSRQLSTFNLTMMQYRVLETLYRQGPQYQLALSHKFRCTKQNVAHVVKTLERFGCVRRSGSARPRTATTDWVNPAGARSMKRPAQGRRIVLVRLTPEGKDVIRHVFPKHAKVVKAEMRVLEGREQTTLSRLCRKLQEGDAVRFLKEIVWERPGELRVGD